MSLWKKQESRSLVQQFRERHACHPVETPGLRENHTKIIEELFRRLRGRGLVDRLEHTGSAYTGLEIGPDREFDVTFVIKMDGITIRKHEGEMYYLTASQGIPHSDCLATYCNTTYLHSKKLQTKFYKLFENEAQSISDALHLGYQIKQKKHGTAIQWDVFESGVLLYSVDLVPSIEEANTSKQYPLQFVARSGKGKEEQRYLWRQSFSLQENDLLKKISAGNQCQKEVVRTIKAMIKARPGYCHGWGSLQRFRSYLTYAAVLHEHQRLSDSASWSQDRFMDRLYDTLKYMQDCMVNQCYPHPFLPDVGLTDFTSKVYSANNLRLNNLLKKRRKFRKCFSF